MVSPVSNAESSVEVSYAQYSYTASEAEVRLFRSFSTQAFATRSLLNRKLVEIAYPPPELVVPPEEELPVARLIASNVMAVCETGVRPPLTVNSLLKVLKPFA